MFSGGLFATVLAVVLQAMIFGFRHSYDLSERSITVGLIGLAMGIGYVVFGRNLWPLIFAHGTLNTMSMIGRQHAQPPPVSPRRRTFRLPTRDLACFIVR
jgi:membrane protease YdiL (CAAX protease family)